MRANNPSAERYCLHGNCLHSASHTKKGYIRESTAGANGDVSWLCACSMSHQARNARATHNVAKKPGLLI